MTSTRRIYFTDHNTRARPRGGDPRLPSTVDAAPHYKRDYRRKIIYFWTQRRCA
ncbi:hypothetical protein BJY52DRAFT_1319801 [Lactarius psammicola]|nr:hypothetical protein BJY52DRAFT_1319801 [Lactarius psammicola]